MIGTTMDPQFLLNFAFGLALAAGGWILGRITRALDRLDDDVRLMPDKYVSKTDYRSDIHDIKSMLERITDKMDGKVDK